MTQGSGMGKKSKSGSGMNIPDHISESLETIFWVSNTKLKFFDTDADPQHWGQCTIFPHRKISL
jgi:hypothetical protein